MEFSIISTNLIILTKIYFRLKKPRNPNRSLIIKFYYWITLLGIDPRKAFHTVKGFPLFWSEYRKLKKQSIKGDESCQFGKLYPCFDDKFDSSGQAKGHYFYQDLLIASKIFINQPQYHIDVGSRVDGFVAHVASFRKIHVIDIRKLNSQTPNIEYLQADMMSSLPADLINSSDSLSCLHALEHFGLGRYGDPICWDGHLRGLNNLILILKKGGKLYLSVPIGKPRIEFNAHRIFSVEYLLKMFEGKLQIENFSFVDDEGDLHMNMPLNIENILNNFGCIYGCGIFELIKS